MQVIWVEAWLQLREYKHWIYIYNIIYVALNFKRSSNEKQHPYRYKKGKLQGKNIVDGLLQNHPVNDKI